MTHQLDRRGFVAGGIGFGAASFFALFPGSTNGQPGVSSTQDPGTEFTAVPPEFLSQDRKSIRELVGAAHFNFDRVKEMVTSRPALAKASWDWGFGDWESALGAASHVGRPDIARLLLDYGARPDIFTFTMLGHLDAVKAIVAAMPGIQRAPGPHGITLLAHARNRAKRDDLSAGERARLEAVQGFLESLGDADLGATSLPLSDKEKLSYVGLYLFGNGDDDRLEVKISRRGELTIQRGEATARVLHRVETHVFAPAGAPEVRIRFVAEGDRITVLSVHDPELLVNARRAEV